MITSKISYSGQLRTSAIHVRSSQQIITDAPVDNQGKGEAFSPTDLVSSALCSCMMTIMGQVAEREGINMEGITADVTKVMSATPRRIAEIMVVFDLSQLSITDRQRKMLENAARTCPVALSLSPDVKQTISYTY